MGGQSLIYSFVANGTNVLAEYTAFSGNFSTIAIQCLQKLPANNNKFTYTCDQHTFNYLVEDGYSTFVSPSLFFCRSFSLAIWSFFLFPYILCPLSSLKIVSLRTSRASFLCPHTLSGRCSSRVHRRDQKKKQMVSFLSMYLWDISESIIHFIRLKVWNVVFW
jgi:hypothetical protein